MSETLAKEETALEYPPGAIIVETEDLTTPDEEVIATAIALHCGGVVPQLAAIMRSEDNQRRRVVIFGPADDEQARFFHEHPVLFTGLVWNHVSLAERAELATKAGLPDTILGEGDVFDVLPEDTKAYLLFWQRQVNTGECWHAPGTIGAHADSMISEGFLLGSRKTLLNAYGMEVPSRYKSTQGHPGTDAFVAAVMGARYLAWLKGHEET